MSQDAADVTTPQDATKTDAPTDTALAEVAEDVVLDAAPDVPTDTGPTKEQLCQGYQDQYKQKLPALRACQTDSECNTQVADDPKCACQLFVNAGAAGWTGLQQSLQDFYAHKCSTCFEAKCTDDPTKQYLGVCQAGQCASQEATCAGIEAAWKSLTTDAQMCEKAADCNGSLGVSVNCDACKVPANGARLAETAAQGKYAALLKKLWEDQACGQPAPCACAPFAATDCVAGKCVAN